MATKITDLTWTLDPSADHYGERAELGDRGIVLLVFCDQYGTEWGYGLEIDGEEGEPNLGFDTKEEAREEALADALGQLRRSDDD